MLMCMPTTTKESKTHLALQPGSTSLGGSQALLQGCYGSIVARLGGAGRGLQVRSLAVLLGCSRLQLLWAQTMVRYTRHACWPLQAMQTLCRQLPRVVTMCRAACGANAKCGRRDALVHCDARIEGSLLLDHALELVLACPLSEPPPSTHIQLGARFASAMA